MAENPNRARGRGDMETKRAKCAAAMRAAREEEDHGDMAIDAAGDVNASLPRGVMFAAYAVSTREYALSCADGSPIHALRLGLEPGRAVILCHGFGGNKNIRDFVALAQDLSLRYCVYTFDFRGHGLSPGRSTFGYRETLDLDAVVRLARQEGNRRVAVVGFSMGGVVAMRYAALHGGLDAVVAVSVPADIATARAPGARLIRALMGNPLGRALAARRYGVRVSGEWKRQAAPADLVGLISPQPFTIIQGEDDFIFEVEQARELAHRAGDGCRLKTFPDFGHAEQGYGPHLVEYLLEVLGEDLD